MYNWYDYGTLDHNACNKTFSSVSTFQEVTFFRGFGRAHVKSCEEWKSKNNKIIQVNSYSLLELCQADWVKKWREKEMPE